MIVVVTNVKTAERVSEREREGCLSFFFFCFFFAKTIYVEQYQQFCTVGNSRNFPLGGGGGGGGNLTVYALLTESRVVETIVMIENN